MLIRNLTASPFDLQSKSGSVRLPANGEVEADFEDEYLELLRAGMAVEVIEGSKPEHQPKRKRGRPRKSDARNVHE